MEYVEKLVYISSENNPKYCLLAKPNRKHYLRNTSYIIGVNMKLCKDCEHFSEKEETFTIRDPFSPYTFKYAQCTSTKPKPTIIVPICTRLATTKTTTDLVYGETTTQIIRKPLNCHDERTDDEKCGEEGKFFIQRASPLKLKPRFNIKKVREVILDPHQDDKPNISLGGW